MSAVVQPQRILIVEDDAGNRLTCEALLKDEGFSVATADSLAAARQLVGAGIDIELVLLDQKLGDGLGTELLPLLRATLPAAKVIMITGEASVRSLPGVDSSFVKAGPFTALLALIRKCLF